MEGNNTMENAKKTNQLYDLVALADMEPCEYQRATNAPQVAGMVENFDEAKLGILTVSERNGKYGVIDGAHRARALRLLGYTHAPCLVLSGLTYQQEADYYRRQNQDKRLLSPGDLFKGGMAAGDEHCIRINSIVRANGFRLGSGCRNFYELASVRTLQTIAEDYGYDVLDSELRLIANTWAGIPKASQRECLLGVAEFVSRYGTANFAARMQDKFGVIWYSYSEAMRARGTTGTSASRKKLCRIMVEHYNKGIAKNSKKRLVWEESA
jgi:hypothetical protein